MTQGAPWRRQRARHGFRLNVWLGRFIPCLLLAFVVRAYTLVAHEGASCLIENAAWRLLYRGQFIILLAALAYCYLAILLAPADHSEPPFEPPVAVRELRVPFECDADGKPTTCDSCGGGWRPLQSRHCRDCGTCRCGFDHHCAWVHACITTAHTFKPFFLFCCLVPTIIGTTAPLIWVHQYKVTRLIVASMWHDEHVGHRWWSRWYSWAGGPVYRYLVGTWLSFRHYCSDSSFLPTPHDGMQCPRLARPSFEVLAMSCFSFILLFVAVAMVVMTVRNACRGVGTIEVERMRRWRHLYKKSGDAALQRWDPRIRLYVPGEDGREGGVILVDPHVKLFDLGVSRNWQTLMGDHWWQWLLPWPTSPAEDAWTPRISAEALRTLRVKYE